MPLPDGRPRLENAFYRALLLRLHSITPRMSKSGALLDQTRRFYDPACEREDVRAALPFPSLEEDAAWDAPDPLHAAVHGHPRTQELRGTLATLAEELKAQLGRRGSRRFHIYERSVREHAEVVERIVFDYAFRLGQVWPSSAHALPDAPAVRRLARVATDLRAPAAHRLRVMLLASLQALEELGPHDHPEPAS